MEAEERQPEPVPFLRMVLVLVLGLTEPVLDRLRILTEGLVEGSRHPAEVQVAVAVTGKGSRDLPRTVVTAEREAAAAAEMEGAVRE